MTSLIAIAATVAILFTACKKINESTTLGGDLIPPVDNITTFDTTLTVYAYNDTFGLANDSQYLNAGEEQFLGLINSDPIFGKTDARMFLELKPTLYGFYPFNRPDSVKIDSIVLVLGYLETYGDTNTAQSVKVYELNSANNFTRDSAYLIRLENFTYNTGFPLSKPGQSFFPRNLKDSVKAFQDTSLNQLRIKLDTNLARRFFNYDTSNAYKTDSIFKTLFRGFALRSEGGGNAIMGFNLNDANTKLAIYYNNPKKGGGGRDTSVTYFRFTSLSASANYVKRDYSGTPSLASINNGTASDPLVFIQNTPGTFATLKIPDLATMSNRVIHRAELIMEQQYDPSDTVFRTPDLLYLDAADPSISSNYKFRTIPYDLALSVSGAFDLVPFGSYPLQAVDAGGRLVKNWHFNITRYAQHILTHTQSLYDLRVLAPFSLNEKYGIPPGDDLTTTIFINPTIAKGRVRLTGNTGPADLNPHRMRLRVIYSKL